MPPAAGAQARATAASRGVGATRLQSALGHGPAVVHRGLACAALLGSALVGTAWGTLPTDVQVALFAVGVALFGTPHGGLDHRIARPLLRPRFGATWPAVFIAGYLALGGLALAAWWAVPAFALGAFLLLSVLHFGAHDAVSSGRLRTVEIVARGAAPVVLPALCHSGDIALLFAWVVGDAGAAALLDLLRGPAAVVWAAAAVVTIGFTRHRAAAVELAAVVVALALLPPLIAFTLYFCLVHAPRAMIMTAKPDESAGALIKSAAPFSAAAVAVGAAGFLLLSGQAPPAVAVVRTGFIWLSALTVPHMALAALARRRPVRCS